MEVNLNVEENIAEKAYKRINDILGDDMNNIGLCNKLYEEMKCQKEELENQALSARSEIPVKLSAAERDADEACQQLSDLTLEYNNLQKDVSETLLNTEPVYNQLIEYKNQMKALQNSLIYLQTLKYTQDISDELSYCFPKSDDETCIQKYKLLCSLFWNLSESHCENLISYIKSVILYWHNILKEKLSNDYEDVLKNIKWPFISTSSHVLEPPPTDLKPKFQSISALLLNIQLPEIQDSQPVGMSSLVANFPPLPLPIETLIIPLRKRFIYHFCGKKGTNRPDKPEWMFLQLLTWIKDHEHFLDSWVQPVFDEFADGSSNVAKIEFISGFVKLATDKLQTDLPDLLHNDSLIAHTIDETLSFHRELTKSYDYPSSYPSVLSVLTQAQIFVKWTNMERKFAKERMDDMLSDKTAWDIFFENDKLKITECGDLFVTMLIAINDRYSSLPQPGHRLQFLDVQLELIDDFRLRLVQLLHGERNDPMNSKLPSILNTIHYLVTVLTEWGNNTLFIMLFHYKKQLDKELVSDNSMSVFDGVIYLLNRIIDDLTGVICETVMLEVKAKSRQYRNDSWFAKPSWNTILFPTLTPSGCPMFQVLGNSLHCFHNKLAPDIFKKCWEMIASQLTKMIIEDVILENMFSDGGAQQLHFDVRRNLLLLFSQYTSKPEAYFLPLLEACSLLCLDRSIDISYLPMKITHLCKDHITAILDRRRVWSSTRSID